MFQNVNVVSDEERLRNYLGLEDTKMITKCNMGSGLDSGTEERHKEKIWWDQSIPTNINVFALLYEMLIGEAGNTGTV